MFTSDAEKRVLDKLKKEKLIAETKEFSMKSIKSSTVADMVILATKCTQALSNLDSDSFNMVQAIKGVINKFGQAQRRKIEKALGKFG